MPLTYHLAPEESWEGADPAAPYAAPSLDAEGFIHCTDEREAMVETANRHYGSDPRTFVVLTVDLEAIGSPWRYDEPGSPYPHVYGPLDRSAIVAIDRPIRDADGRFLSIVTPAAAPVADAIVKLGGAVRMGPLELHRLVPGPPVGGPAVPCRPAGSVDVILEAIGTARPGAILVIDNEGRTDEACIGDLVVAEANAAGIAGIVAWSAIRDTAELRQIGLPVWSLGSVPFGPRAARPDREERLERADVGTVSVGRADLVVADDDGVVVFAAADGAGILERAQSIMATERRQADGIRAGRLLRDQLRFDEYLARRAADPTWDLRRHLSETGGAIET